MMSEAVALYARGAFGVITELYIVPARRSHGIANDLIRSAVDFGRSRNWTRLEVGAPRQPLWRRSLQFYMKVGFTEIGPRLRFPLWGSGAGCLRQHAQDCSSSGLESDVSPDFAWHQGGAKPKRKRTSNTAPGGFGAVAQSNPMPRIARVSA